MSPSEDMTYFITSRKQQLALRASSGLDVSEHFWYVDDEFQGKRTAGQTLFLSVRDGEHVVSCIDNKGRLTSVRIRVHEVL